MTQVRRSWLIAVFAAMLSVAGLALCLSPQNAYADDSDQDILIGMLPIGGEGGTNNVYGSYDGETFYRLAEVYKAEPGNPYQGEHWPQSCTSIMYHDGFFWALSGWSRNNGKFWPSISYSKDLVHWTHPESNSMITGTHGIEIDDLPYVPNGKEIGAAQFDTVAPEWSIMSDGEIYIVFSAGYYGDWYGESTVDYMQAYTVHVTELSANEGRPASDGYLWPSGLTFKAETAKKLAFTNYNGANYIDGQLFTDNGTDYLIIKKDGLTNQLLKTANIDDPTAWQMVNEDVSWGYEGPCMVNFNGKYRLYTDGVTGAKPHGVHETTSDALEKSAQWDEPVMPMYLDENDEQLVTRHGSFTVLKAGTEGWQVAKSLLDEKGRYESGAMHRLYNQYSGEHFYTESGIESGGLTAGGWTYEGIGWHAPTTSSTPVYRLYNPYEPLGDHHYTTDASERDSMVKAGWTNEGTGWYSDDAEGTPLYRQYNPYAYTMGMSGAHNYTADKAENDRLVEIG